MTVSRHELHRDRGLTLGYGDADVVDGLSTSTSPPARITAIVGANAMRQVDAAARARPAARAARGPGRARRRRRCTACASSEVARHARPAAAVARSRRRASPSPTSSAAAGTPTRAGSAAGPSADDAAVAEALEATGTADLADRRVDELSGGQRQRVWIAMALAQETDILLLDEPTTFLDVSHQIEVLDLLTDLNRDRGTTIVMVLHDLNLAAATPTTSSR